MLRWEGKTMQLEDLEVKLNSRIMEAYAVGMSVMEITKTLRKSRVDYVHGFLRDAGCIPTMNRSDYHRSFDVDNRLLAALRNKGYSFGRWCLGWRMDSKQAEVDLKTRLLDEEQTAAHRALHRDFPDVYAKLFGKGRVARFGKAKAPRFYPSLSLTWDDSQRGYVAIIVEHPDVEVVGLDLNDAFEKVMIAYRLFQSIERLNDAIRKFPGE
jgi:hypothetical protein